MNILKKLGGENSRDIDNIGEQVKNQKDEQHGPNQKLGRKRTQEKQTKLVIKAKTSKINNK